LNQYCNFQPYSQPEEAETEFNQSSNTIFDYSDNDDGINVNEENSDDPLIIFKTNEVINDIIQGLRESGAIRETDFSDGELKQGLAHSLPILPSSKESDSLETFSIETVSGISDNITSNNKRRKPRGSYKSAKKESWTQTMSEKGGKPESRTALSNTAEQKRNPIVSFKVTSLVVRECETNTKTIGEIKEERRKSKKEKRLKSKFVRKVLEPTHKPMITASKTAALKTRIAIVSPASKGRDVVLVDKFDSGPTMCFSSDEEEVFTFSV
jgi:hypothetical protein